MTERSPARDELERRLREYVPSSDDLHLESGSTTAAAGVGGLLVGFAWGWLRGRKRRRRR